MEKIHKILVFAGIGGAFIWSLLHLIKILTNPGIFYDEIGPDLLMGLAKDFIVAILLVLAGLIGLLGSYQQTKEPENTLYLEGANCFIYILAFSITILATGLADYPPLPAETSVIGILMGISFCIFVINFYFLYPRTADKPEN